MADYNAFPRAGTAPRSAAIDEGLRSYMNKVYSLMGIAMLVTAGTAYGLHALAIGPDGQATQLGQAIYFSPLKWVITFLPLVLVFAFGAAVNRLSTAGATVLFYVFSAAMGASLSWIFLAYTDMSSCRPSLRPPPVSPRCRSMATRPSATCRAWAGS